MMNQAIHTLDLLFYLGGKIRGVRATVSQILDYGIEVEDTVSASLDYENGARGYFISGYGGWNGQKAGGGSENAWNQVLLRRQPSEADQ